MPDNNAAPINDGGGAFIEAKASSHSKQKLPSPGAMVKTEPKFSASICIKSPDGASFNPIQCTEAFLSHFLMIDQSIMICSLEDVDTALLQKDDTFPSAEESFKKFF